MSTTLERRAVIYCGACGMPPEYCEYGPDFESHCDPWLLKCHPDIHTHLKSLRKPKSTKSASSPKNNSAAIHSSENEQTTNETTDIIPQQKPTRPWTTEERLTAFYVKYQPDKLDSVPGLLEKYSGKETQLFQALIKKYGPEPIDPFYVFDDDGEDDEDDDSDDDNDEVDDGDRNRETVGSMANLSIKDQKQIRRGAAAKTTLKVETRVIIQKITRNKKKATTSVIGMDTVPDLKLKDVAKAFSKKFAGSSSVKDMPNGKKEIILQGDHMDEVAIMVVEQFQVPPDSVYLDMDGEFVPFQR